MVSTNSVSGYAVTPYQNVLVKDAFGNFSTVMKDVTLSTAMGAYLNMLNSAKPATVNGVAQIANENYCAGVDAAVHDWAVPVESGRDTNAGWVRQYDSNLHAGAGAGVCARAYTGWTYATTTGAAPTKLTGTANYDTLRWRR